MKKHLLLVVFGFAVAGSGCSEYVEIPPGAAVSPDIRWGWHGIHEPGRGDGPIIEMLILSHNVGKDGEYEAGYDADNLPDIRFYDSDGTIWEIEFWGNDPKTWKAYKIVPNKERQELPIKLLRRSYGWDPTPSWAAGARPENGPSQAQPASSPNPTSTP